MVRFELNGNIIETDADKNLLVFLRDDMHIKSVKDGCSEGACGACTVLVGGNARKACLQKVQKLGGQRVVTLEGLPDYEKQVFGYCFAKAGAVQCGFCIPGMVMCAKALIDKNPAPNEKEIKTALKGNICRCTGYKKIFEAVKNAAAFIAEKRPVPPDTMIADVPGALMRPTAHAKTLGIGEYTDDIELPDMLYASAVRSAYPRAVVERINAEKAMAHEDAVAVITAKDIPGSVKAGHIVKDWDTLIAPGQATRYVGDAVALVVSKTAESLEAIKRLVEVEYTPLEPIETPEAALAPGAPELHEGGNVLRKDVVKRGEPADEVLKKSKYAVRHVYEMPFTEHAYMEPECAVCEYQDGNLKLYTAGQNIYDEQREIAHILGIDPGRVRVVSKLVGGAFGGKEDMTVQHHAALASFLLQRTVKVKLSRQESIHVSTKRHAMTIDMATGCDENGRLTAIRVRILADTGAYASLGGPVVQRACTHAGGPYRYDSVDIEGMAVYTNNPPAGAFRGFGVPQSCFAVESNLNLLAEMAGITPWEIRRRNAVAPGDVLPCGQYADKSTAIIECLDEIADVMKAHPEAGIAAAIKNTGLGVGVVDTGRCVASVEDGKVHLRTGAARVGQGLDSVILQMACKTLGFGPEQIVIEPPDTARTPNSGTTTASRQTMFTGHAVVKACRRLKDKIDNGETLETLEGTEYFGEYTAITDPIDSGKQHPVSHAAYSYGVQAVVLGDDDRIDSVYAAYDVGQLVNRTNAEGQVEGGIVMSLGYALTESFELDQCVPRQKLGTLGLMRALDVPEIDVRFVEPAQRLETAYGAKGLGEIASIPTAPAVAGAYYARDGVFRTKLPLEKTPYRKKEQ